MRAGVNASARDDLIGTYPARRSGGHGDPIIRGGGSKAALLNYLRDVSSSGGECEITDGLRVSLKPVIALKEDDADALGDR